MQRLSSTSAWPIHGRKGIRALEAQVQACSPIPLMAKAGLAIAELALAIAPHSQRIWVAAGPGNNGGDGLEAGMHLHQWGKEVKVSLFGPAQNLPNDARGAWQKAHAAGVQITSQLPAAWLGTMGPLDLCIDALLGIGANRPLNPEMQAWVQTINHCKAQVLAIDLPTGLNPESGQLLGAAEDTRWLVQADHTLCFIAAKPGLFMGHGRDACGNIWLEQLGLSKAMHQPPPCAWLNDSKPTQSKTHASHKGTHGDVAIIGGEPLSEQGMGMTGAAVLAATAALHAGAGRVILSLLSGQVAENVPPDLMQRTWHQLDLEQLHVVCGCGGGQAVRPFLPDV